MELIEKLNNKVFQKINKIIEIIINTRYENDKNR